MDFDAAVDLDAARRVADWLVDALAEVSGSARVATAVVSGGVAQITVSAQGRLVRFELTPQALQLRSDRLADFLDFVVQIVNISEVITSAGRT
jgi:hypothetical protein